MTFDTNRKFKLSEIRVDIQAMRFIEGRSRESFIRKRLSKKNWEIEEQS